LGQAAVSTHGLDLSARCCAASQGCRWSRALLIQRVARSRCQMTFPTKPKSPYDYVTFQAGSPADPLPANEVASDFADHKTSIDAIIEFQKLVQRSDGRLNNGSVRPETLSAGTVALIGKWTPRGPGVTATAYAVNDLVEQPAASGNNYVACSTACRADTSADRNGLQGDRQRPHKPNGFRHETPVRAVVALSNSGTVVDQPRSASRLASRSRSATWMARAFSRILRYLLLLPRPGRLAPGQLRPHAGGPGGFARAERVARRLPDAVSV